MILSESIISVTEFRKNPSLSDGVHMMAVLKNNKPEYYCVSPLKLAQLLRAEKELNDIASKRGE